MLTLPYFLKKCSWAIQGLNYFLKEFMTYSGVFFKNGKVHELKLYFNHFIWFNFIFQGYKYVLIKNRQTLHQKVWKNHQRRNPGRTSIQRQVWSVLKIFQVKFCALYFHTWTKHRCKIQLQLANSGLNWFEATQICPVISISKLSNCKSLMKEFKIWI